MGLGSSIEWTEATWNPVAGCTVLSPGCTNCYAMRMAHRLEAMGQEKYRATTRISGGRAKWAGKIVLDERSLTLPKTWAKGRLVFVNSMSDLFHDAIPFEFIRRVFRVMEETPRHTYQILTKRAERLRELSVRLNWPANVWMGVSVESQKYWKRVDELRLTGAHVRFLSLEPLLGPLASMDLAGIDWVIAGGESGPNARPMNPVWVRNIRDACIDQNVAFHFKQWGGVNKKAQGRILDGRTWDDMPSSKRVRTAATTRLANDVDAVKQYPVGWLSTVKWQYNSYDSEREFQVMKEPGLDGRHRDKDVEIQQKRSDTLNKNLSTPIPQFRGNTTLGTMRERTGKVSEAAVRRAAAKMGK